jgi:NADH-quinone oxidoreductase subunit J
MLYEISTSDKVLAILIVLLGASGTYLMLPHRLGRATPRVLKIAGLSLAGLAVLLFATFWKGLDSFLATMFFYAFGLAAIIGGTLTVTSRDPVRSALWFASVILSTAGLFLLAGAQFLAAGTVIVYAGAIIVTFLFVIMLAQMEGRAIYDRAARSPGPATFTCFLLLWGLLYALLSARYVPPEAQTAEGSLITAPKRLISNDELLTTSTLTRGRPVARVLDMSVHATNRLAKPDRTLKPHVAGLGESLFTDNLIIVELAGTLLFVALIGALMIAAPKAPVRPAKPPAPPYAPHV